MFCNLTGPSTADPADPPNSSGAVPSMTAGQQTRFQKFGVSWGGPWIELIDIHESLLHWFIDVLWFWFFKMFMLIHLIDVLILFDHFCLLGFVENHGPASWGLVQDMRPLFIAKLGSPKGRLFQDVCLVTGLLIGFRAACFCFLLISNVGFQAFKTETCYAVLDDDDDDDVDDDADYSCLDTAYGPQLDLLSLVTSSEVRVLSHSQGRKWWLRLTSNIHFPDLCGGSWQDRMGGPSDLDEYFDEFLYFWKSTMLWVYID